MNECQYYIYLKSTNSLNYFQLYVSIESYIQLEIIKLKSNQVLQQLGRNVRDNSTKSMQTSAKLVAQARCFVCVFLYLLTRRQFVDTDN